MSITVYTKPLCPSCELTRRKLDNLGVPYDAVPLQDRPDVLDRALAAGVQSAPIVEADGDLFGGFRPDRLKEIARRFRAGTGALA